MREVIKRSKEWNEITQGSGWGTSNSVVSILRQGDIVLFIVKYSETDSDKCSWEIEKQGKWYIQSRGWTRGLYKLKPDLEYFRKLSDMTTKEIIVWTELVAIAKGLGLISLETHSENS